MSEFNENGSFTWQPNGGFKGMDWFQYYATDTNLSSITVTVWLYVTEEKQKADIRLYSEVFQEGTKLANDVLAKNGSIVPFTHQWLDYNLDGLKDVKDLAQPYSYVREEALKLTAAFRPLNASQAPRNAIRVRGTVRAGAIQLARFKDTQINYDGVSKSYMLLGASAVNLNDNQVYHFPQVVKFYQHFQIAWEVSTDNGATWKDANTSGNNTVQKPCNRHLYLAYAVPQGALGRPKALMQTLLYYGTSGADGQGDPAQVLAGIWSKFSAATAKRADGQNLHYYGLWSVGRLGGPAWNESYARLLSSQDGQCGPWLGLLYGTILANGLHNTTEVGEVTPKLVKPPVDATGLLVKSWTFGAENGPDQTYLYKNETHWARLPGGLLDERFNKIPYEDTAMRVYSWVGNPAVTYNGGAGQNSTNPPAAFPNHTLVLIGSTYYDPSYGKTYTSLLQFQQQALAGIYKLDPPPPTAANRNMPIRKIDPTGNTLLISDENLSPSGLGW